MKKVIIMIGNIGSGKSTIARNYVVVHDYVCVSKDRLRYAIGAGTYIFNTDYEKVISKTNVEMFKKFVDLGVNIVVDEANMRKKTRRPYITYAKENGYFIEANVLPNFGKEVCVSRRTSNPHGNSNRKTWERVWEDFNINYEEPTEEEFDRITNVKVYDKNE